MSNSANLDNLDDNDIETLIWKGRFSFKHMLGAGLGATLVTALMLLAVIGIQPLQENRAVWVTMVTLIALIWIVLIGVAVYYKLSRRFEITTQQIRHRRGLVLHQVDRIEMIDIDDVGYRQGPVQTLLHVGTIQLISSDTSYPTLKMPGVSGVSKVANLIDDARQRERRKLGISAESP